MSHNRLPKEKLRSLLLFYPVFFSLVFWISGGLEARRVLIAIGAYILAAILNIMNINFLLDKCRLFRLFMVEAGTKLSRRMIFLLLGFLVLLAIDGRVNFLYQVIYIAVFISTDTYIGYMGERYRQLFGKE